jgi:hypothetical protein
MWQSTTQGGSSGGEGGERRPRGCVGWWVGVRTACHILRQRVGSRAPAHGALDDLRALADDAWLNIRCLLVPLSSVLCEGDQANATTEADKQSTRAGNDTHVNVHAGRGGALDELRGRCATRR